VIESRSEARANGHKHYFTGKPCPWGHVALRTVSTGNCLVCGQERSQTQRDEQRQRTGKPRRNPARETAHSKGDKRYFTGIPCPKGHLSERFVSSRACVACAYERIAGRRATTDGRREERIQQNEWRHRTGRLVRERLAAKRSYDNNRDTWLARGKRSRERNQSRWQSNKYRNDPNFRLARILRQRLRGALKGQTKKIGSFVSDLGCSLDFLRGYIESQFSDGMTWGNHGAEWELDHVRPLCSFELTNREEFIRAAHYTNLQPLWMADHHAKRSSDLALRRKT
jgi:hypothetical protein